LNNFRKEVKRMKIKKTLKKYRSTLVMGAFLLFNIAESAYFGTPFLTINDHSESVAELLCDHICSLGMFFACFMAIYDLVEANARFQYAIKIKCKG